MIDLEYLQIYWWILISVLGAALVFLLFVQGGQTMLLGRMSPMERTMRVNALGRKWELTFTTLVVFGGAFFASFPLFYSTSFGGAYWLWMIILFSFIIQAVSYEFRNKHGNLYGTGTYDTFLFINGCVGCLLLGVAVSMFFFGGDFTVTRGNLLDTGSPVISTWAPSHGFEAIFYWKNWALALAVLFLARTQGALFFMDAIQGDEAERKRLARSVGVNGAIFVLTFVWFVVILLISDGQQWNGAAFEWVSFKYWHNFCHMWWVMVLFLLGVLATLYGIGRTVVSPAFRHGIWWTGIGSSVVVLCLFWVAGFCGTPFYPSLADPASSLSIYNASSTQFTLWVMAWVSLGIPVVAAYIIYVWWRMTRTPITPREMEEATEKY